MTLRRRIFLLVSGVVVLLLVGETLLVRSLAGQLDRDVTTVAVRVGEDLLEGFEFRHDARLEFTGETEESLVVEGQPAQPKSAPAGEIFIRRQVWVGRSEAEAGTGAPPAGAEMERPPPGSGVHLIEEQEIGVLRLVPHEHERVILLRGPAFERRLAIPTAPVTSTVEKFESRLLVGSLALLALGLLATGFVVHRATRPLDELRRAAARIGDGEWGIAVPVARGDEVGAAVAAFNSMSTRLAELDQENRRLADSEHLSELAEVARGLAHTLRNPLNALGLAVERLAGENDAERADELAERCRRQIRRIDGSLRSFLALASAPAAASEPVELGTLAREVALEALQDSAGGVRVEVDAPGRVEIAGVAAELKAILQALVVNACEASPEGGAVAVRVRAAGEGGGRVEIEDEGAGVAAEIAARLFAPHVTTKPHGSGMGLYLARRLATTRYGGNVALAPRSPRGTRATVTLVDRREAAT